MRPLAGSVLALAMLGAGCAPVSVTRAEQLCRDQIGTPSTGVQGRARVGVVSDGANVRLTRRVDLDFTAATSAGRDPEQAWRSCVYRRSGQLPTRPFSSL